MICYYKLRCDLRTVSVASLRSVYLDADAYAYVLEGMTTENPHVHFYLATTVTNAALRARIRNVGLKGNGGYSLKVLEEEYPIEYFAYLCKEGEVTWKNIPQAVIDESREYDLRVKKSIKENKRSMIDILEEECKDIEGDKVTKYNLCVRIVEYYVKKRKLMNKNIIANYVDTLWVLKNPYNLGCYVSDIMERMEK